MADISVPYWNIVDVNMLCEGARLIGFDLDNTLARSKKTPATSLRLKKNMPNIFWIPN